MFPRLIPSPFYTRDGVSVLGLRLDPQQDSRRGVMATVVVRFYRRIAVGRMATAAEVTLSVGSVGDRLLTGEGPGMIAISSGLQACLQDFIPMCLS